MKASPTSRSLTILRRDGWTAHGVEKWNPHAKVRQDFGGFGDILAYRQDRKGVLAIQACAGASHAARETKVCDVFNVIPWILAGNFLEVWSWRLAGPRGKRKLWQVRKTRVIVRSINQKWGKPEPEPGVGCKPQAPFAAHEGSC